MSVNLEPLKEDENDINIDQYDKDDAVEQKECSLDLNGSVENQLDNQEVKLKNVQNSIIIPQDLRKTDRVLLLNMKTEECDVQSNSFRKSTTPALPSWKHGNLDDDVYTTTGTDQTLPSYSLQITSIDGFFNRKRGRPPKNRFVEVYKHTHQKPQATFTSFKLEKRQLTEAVSNYDDSNSNFAQSIAEISMGCESDNNYPMINSGQELINENSTLCRNRFEKVNTIPSTHRCDKISEQQLTIPEDGDNISNIFAFKNNCNLALPALSAKQTKRRFPRDDENDNNVTCELGPETKNPKLYEIGNNVTVIRAAGTFYPENCKGNPCNNLNQRARDIIKGNQTTLISSGNEVKENVCLKYEAQIKPTNDFESSTSTFMSPVGSFSVLPQTYNILQMQQQLIAYYQRLALMTPALSQLESTIVHNAAVAEPPCSQSSFTTSADTETDILHKKNLINIILNLQKQQLNQTSTNSELTIGNKTGGPLRHVHRQSTERKFECSKGRTPFGYLRFRFNEDCDYEKCGYRQHQSHFHCNRADCQYSCCKRTRFVQHTARHGCLDTLMGTDFQQCRDTMTCKFINCPYAFDVKKNFNEFINNRNSSHFHCLRCVFVCTDTNKVVAHRRLHRKMEFIRLAGFREVSTKENCMISNDPTDFHNATQSKNVYAVASDQAPVEHFINETITPQCPYALRQAHYHCLVCNCSVLSRSQLLAHRHRRATTSTSIPQQHLLERVKTTTEKH